MFSPKAANNLLRDSFRLDIPEGLTPKREEQAVIRGIQNHLEDVTRTVRSAMSQATLNSRDPNDVELYLGRNPISFTGNRDVDAHSRALIVGLVTNHRNPNAASEQATSIYRRTVTGFDDYFSAVAERSSTPPGPSKAAQAQSFFVSANRAHADFLGRAAGVTQRVTGPGTEAVTNKISHAKQALGLIKPKITVTDSEIVNALSELGRSVPNTREAQLASLNEAYKASKATFLRVAPEPPQNFGKAPTTPPSGGGGAPRAAKRRVRSAAQIAADLQKAGWGVEAAQAEAAKIVRSRKTDAEDRQDKKCGKSGIPEGKKCSKKTLAAGGSSGPSAEKPTTSPEPANKPKLGPKLFKVAVIATAVGLSVGTASLAKKYSPEILRTGISTLSSGAVNNAIKSLPQRFQEPASRLQGNAKLSLAIMSLKADKMEMVGVNEKSNFSTWKSPKGGFVSVGSVGDSLIAFYTEPGKSGSTRVPGYTVGFKVDQHYRQKTGVDRKQATKIAKTVETMFNDHVEKLPPNALLVASAFSQDGNGVKRANIYSKKGFVVLKPGTNGGQDILGIFKVKGKLVKPPEDEQERQAMWQKIHSEA